MTAPINSMAVQQAAQGGADCVASASWPIVAIVAIVAALLVALAWVLER